MKELNIMIVGVGGQGSLLASKLLGRLLLSQGCDVKVSEVHGMSQRGGSVVTYVRCGERVASPVIDRGEADFIVSFELLEAARWLEFLRPGGQIVTSTQQIDPMPVITGAADYPAGLVDAMRAAGAKVDADKCVGCNSCMRIGCPAISVRSGKARIDDTLCVGCGVCSQLCKVGALTAGEEAKA